MGQQRWHPGIAVLLVLLCAGFGRCAPTTVTTKASSTGKETAQVQQAGRSANTPPTAAAKQSESVAAAAAAAATMPPPTISVPSRALASVNESPNDDAGGEWDFAPAFIEQIATATAAQPTTSPGPSQPSPIRMPLPAPANTTQTATPTVVAPKPAPTTPGKPVQAPAGAGTPPPVTTTVTVTSSAPVTVTVTPSQPGGPPATTKVEVQEPAGPGAPPSTTKVEVTDPIATAQQLSGPSLTSSPGPAVVVVRPPAGVQPPPRQPWWWSGPKPASPPPSDATGNDVNDNGEDDSEDVDWGSEEGPDPQDNPDPQDQPDVDTDPDWWARNDGGCEHDCDEGESEDDDDDASQGVYGTWGSTWGSNKGPSPSPKPAAVPSPSPKPLNLSNVLTGTRPPSAVAAAVNATASAAATAGAKPSPAPSPKPVQGMLEVQQQPQVLPLKQAASGATSSAAKTSPSPKPSSVSVDATLTVKPPTAPSVNKTGDYDETDTDEEEEQETTGENEQEEAAEREPEEVEEAEGTLASPAGPATSPKPLTQATPATKQPLPAAAAVAAPAAAAATGSSGRPVLGPAFASPAAAVKVAAALAAAGNATSKPGTATSGAVVVTAETTAPNPKPFIFKQAGAKSNVTIGCIVPLQGSQELVGNAVMIGLKMAITDWAPKTLPGVNINLTCINTKCRDVAAYHAMNKLADEGVVAAVGEVCSGASVAAAGVAQTRKLPLVSPSSTSPTLSQVDFFFRTVPSDRFQGVAAAKLVYKNGGRNVGLMYEDNAYGYGLAFSFIAGFTNSGGSVPVVYSFKPGAASAKVAVEQILAGKKDSKAPLNAVFIATTDLDFVADFLKAAAAAKLGLPLYGGDSLADSSLFNRVKATPAAIDGLTATTPTPGSDAFMKSFEKFSGGAPYNGFAAQGYDAMTAVLKALKAAGPPFKGTNVAAQLHKQAFEGVSGPIAFDEFGDLKPSSKAYAWVKFDRGSGSPVVKGYITN